MQNTVFINILLNEWTALFVFSENIFGVSQRMQH